MSMKTARLPNGRTIGSGASFVAKQGRHFQRLVLRTAGVTRQGETWLAAEDDHGRMHYCMARDVTCVHMEGDTSEQ